MIAIVILIPLLVPPQIPLTRIVTTSAARPGSDSQARIPTAPTVPAAAGAMKVHPAPRKRNMTFPFQCSASGGPDANGGLLQKKLRRLPHIFSKVLELPLSADADVDVREDGDGFLFTASVDVEDGAAPATVRARAVDIYPGVTKVVIRDGAEEEGDEAGGGRRNSALLLVDDLELDRWRFRLPPGTRPELASASYVDGDLVVSIPKRGAGSSSDSEDEDQDEQEEEEEDGGVTGAGIGRLVVVQ